MKSAFLDKLDRRLAVFLCLAVVCGFLASRGSASIGTATVSAPDPSIFCRLGAEGEIFQNGFEGVGPIRSLKYPFFEPIPGLEPVAGPSLGNDWRLLESLTPDLNGDGRQDVVTFIGNELNFLGPDGPIRILFNNGDGTLTDCTEQLFGGAPPLMDYPRDIHLADFNGDSLPDLFFSNFGTEAIQPFPCEQNRLLLSTESGGLVDATATHLPKFEDASHGSSVADVDLDGDIDIWVTNLGCVASGRSYLMKNDGTGRFDFAPGGPGGAPIFPSPFDIPRWSLFIDYDADGDDDLYVSIGRGGLNEPFEDLNLIIPNDGQGIFLLDNAVTLPPPTQLCAGSKVLTPAQDARVVDWNGDGWPDITTFLSSCKSPMIQILINDGEGGFRDETDQRVPFHGSAPGGAPRFSILDADGNGALDIIYEQIPDEGGRYAFYFFNDGTGHFTLPEVQFPADAWFGPRLIVLDLNNDGIADQLQTVCVDFNPCTVRTWHRRLVQAGD